MALEFLKNILTGIFHDRITHGALGAYCLVLDAKALTANIFESGPMPTP